MSDRLVGAVCDTLLGSLWLGILLAVAAGGVVLCTRARSSALRYSLLVGVLVAFAVGVVGIGVSKMVVSERVVSLRTGMPEGVGGYSGLPVMGRVDEGVMDKASAYLNSHSNIIVLVWFLIICAKSIQLGVGLYGTYRWKHTCVSAVPGGWRDRLAEMAGVLGVKKCVTLLESGLARVPLVIGHLKPVILLPAGLLTTLPADEIEAILLHELAHIRRCDYLVNLLQSLLEIIFFFNPAVWWVSGLIRTERENCCDDLAVGENNNMTGYIRALLSCEQYRQRVPAQAMAFPGGKDGLLARVMRMSGERNHSLSYLEKTLLAVGLMVCGFCWCAFRGQKVVAQVPRQVVQAPRKVVQVSEKVMRATEVMRASEQVERVERPAVAVVQGKVERGGRNVEKGRSSRGVEAKGLGGEPVRMVEPVMVEPVMVEPVMVEPVTVEPARVVEPVKATQPRYVDPRLPEIIADMLHDGLIIQTDNLDFLLSGTEFIINGEWQNEAVLARYKKKYVPGNGENGWTWSHSQHCPVPRLFSH